MNVLLRFALLLAVLVVLWFVLRAPMERAYRLYQLVNSEAPDRLPIPVEGVTSASIVDNWGNPRSGGRVHEGIDIFAPRHTPVRSTTRGVIVRKRWNQLGGRTVTVMGPGGYYHYYAHLESWSEREVSDWVEPGDILGTVGNSGNAAGGPPHLHYGIYQRGGGAINPYPFLAVRPEMVDLRGSGTKEPAVTSSEPPGGQLGPLSGVVRPTRGL